MFMPVLFLKMARLLINFFLLVKVLCCVNARTCNPDEGIAPESCDPNICVLPDCACEESEPDIPLADRPQVLTKLHCCVTQPRFKMF